MISRTTRMALLVTAVLIAAGGLMTTLAYPEPPYSTIAPSYLEGPQLKQLELLPDYHKGGSPGLPPGTRPVQPPIKSDGSAPLGGKNLGAPSRGISLAGGMDAGATTPQQALEFRLKSLAHDLR